MSLRWLAMRVIHSSQELHPQAGSAQPAPTALAVHTNEDDHNSNSNNQHKKSSRLAPWGW